MLNRKWVMGAIVASALGAIPVVASAAIYVDIAPPEPRAEVVPNPRAGHIWAPGHYTYRNGQYRWVRGHWEAERRGLYYHPGHWVERNNRWVFVEPRWRNEKFSYGYGRGYANNNPYGDRDRDGVPNRYDRDKDNDGVPNRLDNAPNNPYKR